MQAVLDGRLHEGADICPARSSPPLWARSKYAFFRCVMKSFGRNQKEKYHATTPSWT